MAAKGGVEKLLEEVQITSASWLGDEMLNAMSTDEIDADKGGGGDDSDLDDLSSLSFSDSAQLSGFEGHHRPSFLYYGGTASKVTIAPTSHESCRARPLTQLIFVKGQRESDRCVPQPLPCWVAPSQAVEAEELKRESQRQIAEVQTQNQELRHQNDLLAMKLQHAQRRHAEELARVRSQLAAEATATVEQYKLEAAALREQLNVRQDTLLRALRVGELEYEEMAATPAQQRDLRQAVACEAWQIMQIARRERDEARKEADAARRAADAQQSELEDLRALVVDRRVAAARQDAEAGLSLSEAREKVKDLQRQSDELRVGLADSSGRARRCEEAEAAAKLASAARDAAVREAEELRTSLAKTQQRLVDEDGDREGARSKVQMLELDKQFLQKEVAALTARAEGAEAKAEKRGFKNKELQQQKAALEEQLLHQRSVATAGAGEKLEAELAHIRQRSEAEIGEVKRSTAELYARQNEILQARQEEAVAEADRLRARLDAAAQERDAAVRELREETGYAGSEPELICEVEPNPAIQSNRCTSYLIRDAERLHDTELDENEVIEVVLKTPDQVRAMILGGEFPHALLQLPLLHYLSDFRSTT